MARRGDDVTLVDDVETIGGGAWLRDLADRVRDLERERDAAMRDCERWRNAAEAAWSICADTAPEDCPGPDAVIAAVDRRDDDANEAIGAVQRVRHVCARLHASDALIVREALGDVKEWEK
jgi:hypothetical protein